MLPGAETYTGLVELGVGLIPGGGGTKGVHLRAADEMHERTRNRDPEEPLPVDRHGEGGHLQRTGFDLGIYRKGLDEVVINQARRIAEAKNR